MWLHLLVSAYLCPIWNLKVFPRYSVSVCDGGFAIPRSKMLLFPAGQLRIGVRKLGRKLLREKFDAGVRSHQILISTQSYKLIVSIEFTGGGNILFDPHTIHIFRVRSQAKRCFFSDGSSTWIRGHSSRRN